MYPYLSICLCRYLHIFISIYVFFGSLSLASVPWTPSKSAGVSCVSQSLPAHGLRRVFRNSKPLIVHSTSSVCLICADSYSFVSAGQTLKFPCLLGCTRRTPYFLTSPLVSSHPIGLVQTGSVAHGNGWGRRWGSAIPADPAPAHQAGVTPTCRRVCRSSAPRSPPSSVIRLRGCPTPAPARLVRKVLCIAVSRRVQLCTPLLITQDLFLTMELAVYEDEPFVPKNQGC